MKASPIYKETIDVDPALNPSPSRDPWFDDPENLAMVERGIEDVRMGRTNQYSLDEIKGLLGL